MRTIKPISSLCYNHIVGTGGIGSGIFFSLEGELTLGRNESRMGRLEPFRDYCKQHIIMHYIAVLMGSGKTGSFHSFPIGRIGNDDVGYRLRSMLEKAGMDTSHVKVSSNAATLFSVCFQYPDHSGGNITSSNSASNLVQSFDIDAYFENYQMDGKKGIVLAAPEVPVATRIRLLEQGRKHKMLTVASVLSSEVEEFERLNGFELTSLLAVNIDEAQRIGEIEGDHPDTENIIQACIARLQKANPEIQVLITDGSSGSYCFYKGQTEYTPSLKTKVVSTAGAGDAFLSGTIAGLCCSLPLTKGFSSGELKEFPLQTAVELGTILASYSVTSADTIHEGANASSLYDYVLQSDLLMSEMFEKLFT